MVVSQRLDLSYRCIFAIGDIHGMALKLRKLLKCIPYDPQEDILLFLGDYIDRGPDSREVLETILNLKAKSNRVYCIRGNHEQMFLDCLKGADPILYFFNGGKKTLVNYNFQEKYDGSWSVDVPKEHMDFLDELYHWIDTDQYIFVHAGLKPNVSLDDQDSEDLLWIRHEFILSSFDFGKKVIFGHTPFYEPFMMENKIGIDTGAGYGRKLTCLQLPEENFYFA